MTEELTANQLRDLSKEELLHLIDAAGACGSIYTGFQKCRKAQLFMKSRPYNKGKEPCRYCAEIAEILGME